MLLANLSIFWSFVGILWLLISILLALIILVQKGRGGGLSGAFGGLGSGVLGTKTGDFLTWVTVVFVVLFLLLGIGLAKFHKPKGIAELKPVIVEDPTGAAGLAEDVADVTDETSKEATTEVDNAANAATEAVSGEATEMAGEAETVIEETQKATETPAE